MRNTTIALFAVGIAALPLTAARNLTAGDALSLINVEFSRNIPAESWAPQDPADAVWRSGRTAINNAEWQKAAEIFSRIHSDATYKSSTYRGQSYYWEAYARAQMGGSSQLRQAASLLRTMKSDFPDDAKNIRDSASLLASVEGRLSREFGDEDASANVRESAKKSTTDCPDDDDDDNPRIAALNALMQMNADDAMPLLEKVIARRDACSAGMRAKAMWLIAQKKTPHAADMLVEAAKNDPSSEVRQQAVFWLSQVDGAKALEAVKGILATSKDEDLTDNALFALSRNNDPRAVALLKEYATRSDISSDVRGTAIHWLSQNKENATFLRDLFTKVSDEDSKEQIIYAVAQQGTAESADWLMNIVMNDNVDSDIRKTALYWAAQTGAPKTNRNGEQTAASPNALTPAKLVAMYDRVSDQELKEQLIYLYAQRHETQYVDKLMEIAKGDKNAELRKTAIYWLGQVGSKDPRVIKFLTDLITGG